MGESTLLSMHVIFEFSKVTIFAFGKRYRNPGEPITTPNSTLILVSSYESYVIQIMREGALALCGRRSVSLIWSVLG